MTRGTRLRLKSTGEIFTYAGIDGTCAKMMQEGCDYPHCVRLWGVHEIFEYEDGESIAEKWYL